MEPAVEKPNLNKHARTKTIK